MNFKKNDNNSLLVYMVSLVLVLAPLFLQGCGGGGGGYDNPATEATQTSVLISPQTLNNWTVNGYKNSEGFTKLVVLDVASQSSYVEGHVPGAFLFDSSADLAATRSDGVFEVPSMVATKAQMDDLIQRTGIDENTVIVLTTNPGASNLMQLGRAYFNFRYWGFPKNRLKVLDGNIATYEAAGFALEKTVPPSPAPSTYSVCQLTQNTTVRAPFGEMVTVSEDNNPLTVVVDARSPDEYNGVPGKTAGPTGASGGYVAFEGHVRTAVSMNYTNLLTAEGTLLPKEDLRALFASFGLNGAETSYSYCRTSWRAAIHFLALDGVLAYPTKIYDGAWIEWGQMASVSKAGALTDDSPWRADTASRSEAITYNQDAGLTVYQITDANSYAMQAADVNTVDSAICGGGGGGEGGTVAPGY
jgi:3-mercaptopyruvate sulfurtransferase SseA